MAFVIKTWKDRIVQYANRRLLTKSGGEVEQVTVTRDEGTISEAGDQFNASNMNDLEQRVKAGFDDLNAADLPITSGSATNTKSYIDNGLSGKADTNAFVLNLNKSYYSNSTDLQMVVGQVSMPFSGGVATADISSFIGSSYSFITIAFACAKSTSAVAITGAEVSGTTLTVKTTYSGSTSTDINFLAFARKV